MSGNTFILILCFTCAGCQFVGDENRASERAQPQKTASETRDEVAEIVVLNNGKYLVGGWIMTFDELEGFVNSLPKDTQIHIIDRSNSKHLTKVEELLRKNLLKVTTRK